MLILAVLIDTVLGVYYYVLLFLSFHVKISAHCTWQDVRYIINDSNWDRKIAINFCYPVYLGHDCNVYLVLIPKYRVYFRVYIKLILFPCSTQMKKNWYKVYLFRAVMLWYNWIYFPTRILMTTCIQYVSDRKQGQEIKGMEPFKPVTWGA